MSIEDYSAGTEKNRYIRESLPTEVVAELRRYITEIGSSEFSFNRLLVDLETHHAFKVMNERRSKLGQTIKGIPDSVGEAFASAYQRLIEKGFDGNQSDLLIRWVSTEDSNEVSQIMDESRENGGKIDDKSGLNMSPLGSKADDFFAYRLSQGDHGVLFLYDGRKMQTLSGEEASSDVMLVGGYGYKPKEGEDYSAALIGTIGF